MSGINLRSVNKTILVGKVVGKIDPGKTSDGREYIRLAIETDEYFVVKGESKKVSTKHKVVITNKIVVPAFREHVRAGFYISITGKLANVNGDQVVQVTDHGHDAQIMYIPSDNERETPAREAAPKGGSFDMGSMASLPSNGGGRPQSDDGYFNTETPMQRRGPSKAPEGFENEDDQIPF